MIVHSLNRYLKPCSINAALVAELVKARFGCRNEVSIPVGSTTFLQYVFLICYSFYVLRKYKTGVATQMRVLTKNNI